MRPLSASIAIRPARAEDAPAAAALHAVAAPPGWPDAAWSSLLSDPLVFTAAAEIDGRLSGMAAGRATAGEAEILMVFVSAPARRRGIATALVEWCVDEAARRGAGEVFLEVGIDNAAALALYRGIGFVDAGRRPGYYKPGIRGDALILVRRPALDAPHPAS